VRVNEGERFISKSFRSATKGGDVRALPTARMSGLWTVTQNGQIGETGLTTKGSGGRDFIQTEP